MSYLAALPAREEAVTDEYALPPREALGMIAATGAGDPAKLIRDHAAVELVRTYAQVTTVFDEKGEREIFRGTRLAGHLWERMIRDGVDAEAWSGGTVRLVGSDLIGGEPTVHITGIAFHAGDVERLARQQRSPARAATRPKNAAASIGEPATLREDTQDEPSDGKQANLPSVAAPHEGALLMTHNQAMAVTGTKRTKFYALLKVGTLRRCPNDPRLITAESVRAYVGLGA